LQESGWPGGFHGGLVATCGLNNVGPASRDGDEAHEQHGRISRLPASGVRYGTEWEGDELVLSMQGTTHDRTSKGYHLELERHIAVAGDKSVIRIRDRVTNRGIDEAACMLMYHMNFGFPLIDEQTELRVPAAIDGSGSMKLSAFSAEAEAAYIECAREKGTGTCGEVAVSNPRLGMEVMIRYSQQTLPYLWRWHNRREGMRVFAVEPSNCLVKPRDEAQAAGCLPTLKPGESRSFELEVEVRDY
jgi:galactose mutarotase-like enzyme